MEFKGDFLKSLKTELGIKSMFSYASIYPKASIIGKFCKIDDTHAWIQFARIKVAKSKLLSQNC